MRFIRVFRFRPALQFKGSSSEIPLNKRTTSRLKLKNARKETGLQRFPDRKSDMQLLENETIIASTNKELLVLTNLRLIQRYKTVTGMFYRSIHLSDITSIAITKRKIRLLLYLTLLSTAGSMASMIAELIVGGVVGSKGTHLYIMFGFAALFFFLIYSFYGVSIFSVATPSMRINQPISSRDDAVAFIFKVEQAKQVVRQQPH